MKRVFMITAEALGAGMLSDEAQNTVKSIVKSEKASVSTLRQFGFGNIPGLEFLGSVPHPLAINARICPESDMMDTVSAYWELCGIRNIKSFHAYSGKDKTKKQRIVRELGHRTGHRFLLSSGKTPEAMCQEFKDHMEDFSLIVGFSGTTCHIVAHEDKITKDQLYRIGKIAGNLFFKEYFVCKIQTSFCHEEADGTVRLIAPSKYFVHKQSAGNLVEWIRNHKQRTVMIGRLNEIFSDRYISRMYPEKTDSGVLQCLLNVMNTRFNGLCIADLPGFHAGGTASQYAAALSRLDRSMLKLISHLREGDILIVTGVRGDRSGKEYLPILIYGPDIFKTGNMGTISRPANLAATIAEYLEAPNTAFGTGFLGQIQKNKKTYAKT